MKEHNSSRVIKPGSESLEGEVPEYMLETVVKVQHLLAARDGLNSAEYDLHHIEETRLSRGELLGIEVPVLYLTENQFYWRYAVDRNEIKDKDPDTYLYEWGALSSSGMRSSRNVWKVLADW